MKKIDEIRKFPCQSPYTISNSVAVIGNSGKTKNSSQGAEIDSFERIVRFNNAKLAGYEKDVGTKTTDLVINCHVYNDEPSLKTSGFTAWVSAKEMFSRWSDDTNIVYVNTNLPSRGRGSVPDRLPFYIMSKDFFDFIANQLYHAANALNIKVNTLPIPTVGFATVACLVYYGVKPTLFGFSMPDDKSWDHYFEDRPKPSVSHNHEVEKHAYKRMWDQGLIDVR